jgi:hypothetical protein
MNVLRNKNWWPLPVLVSLLILFQNCSEGFVSTKEDASLEDSLASGPNPVADPSPLPEPEPDPVADPSPLPEPVSGTLVLRDGFEDGLGNWGFSGNTTTRTSSEVARSGQFSAHMKVGPKDSVVYRTELVANDKGVFRVGEEYCIRASVQLKRWTTMPSWSAVFQTHAVPGGENWNCVSGRNSITLAVNPSGQIALHVIKEPRQNAGTSNAAIANFAYGSPVEFDKWYDFRFRYRPSFSSDGILEAWQDGKKIYSQFGGNVDMFDRCGKPADPWTYMKIGIYKDANDPGTQEVFYDEVEIRNGADICKD